MVIRRRVSEILPIDAARIARPAWITGTDLLQ